MADKKRSVSLRKVINNDRSLIVFALVLAIIIWAITSLNIGTDETRTITVKAPITLSDRLSKQVGMNYYSLQDSVDISVTIVGAKYVIGQVDENDLNIKFDTSNVNRAGEQSIPILVTNKSKTKDFAITNTYPSTIDAYFDVDETKTFDVQLKYDDDVVADGYVFGTPLISEDKVVINGPSTFVDRIDSVGINVDFGNNNNLTEPFNTECDIILEGSGIEQSYLKIYSKNDNETEIKTLAVTLPVLKETTLPVEVAFDNMPSGLKTGDYKVVYSPKTIAAGVLESADVKSAVVGRVDFKEVNIGNNTFNFEVANTQGFTPLDESVSNVTVKVNIADTYEKKAIAINLDDIELTGGSADAAVKSMNKSTIIVIAPKDAKITASNLTIKCDISSENDDNEYPLDITVNNSNAWVFSDYYVSLY